MKQSEFSSQVNKWKQGFDTTEPAPAPEFKPLKSWPAREHLRQGEIDALRAAPSVFDNRGR